MPGTYTRIGKSMTLRDPKQWYGETPFDLKNNVSRSEAVDIKRILTLTAI